MFEKYERKDPSPDIEYKVQGITITSMIEHTTTTTQQQDIPMKSAYLRKIHSDYNNKNNIIK